MPNEAMGLNVGDACRRRCAEDGSWETRSNDQHARTIMGTAIRLWTQQVTRASRPNYTGILREASINLNQEDKMSSRRKEITPERRVGPFFSVGLAHSDHNGGTAVDAGPLQESNMEARSSAM